MINRELIKKKNLRVGNSKNIYLEIPLDLLWQCGVSLESDSPLFWLVLVLKVSTGAPQMHSLSINFRDLMCYTCHFQSGFLIFVYFGFLCLQVSSVSNFPPTQGGEGDQLFRFICSVVFWE